MGRGSPGIAASIKTEKGKRSARLCRTKRSSYANAQQTWPMTMKRQEILDLYFMEARAKLIDLAAFMDRVNRAEGDADFRWAAFQKALKELDQTRPDRARQVLLSLSDPTTDPMEKAPGKGATGAWPGAQ
jgi:hypothetical protein